MAITNKQFEEFGAEYCIEPALIKAIYEKEASSQAFVTHDGVRVPNLLYEPHIFARYTGGKYNRSHPHLSSASWDRRRYNWTNSSGSTATPAGKHRQHYKLEQAVRLDRDAALMSASYGAFQIMGFNWKECGYESLQAFINAMWESETEHLRALFGYLQSRKLDGRSLLDWLKAKRFDKVGFGYNGPSYKSNNWDTDVARFYQKHSRG